MRGVGPRDCAPRRRASRALRRGCTPSPLNRCRGATRLGCGCGSVGILMIFASALLGLQGTCALALAGIRVRDHARQRMSHRRGRGKLRRGAQQPCARDRDRLSGLLPRCRAACHHKLRRCRDCRIGNSLGGWICRGSCTRANDELLLLTTTIHSPNPMSRRSRHASSVRSRKHSPAICAGACRAAHAS